jgi:tRNA A-37 threonylcarbamoyl transferase component Bud32
VIKHTIFDSKKMKHILSKKSVLIKASYIQTLGNTITKLFVNVSPSDLISSNFACYEVKTIFHDFCLVSRQHKLKHVQKYAQKHKRQQ